jgi:uncharacterized membrane protein (DUF2068 family)
MNSQKNLIVKHFGLRGIAIFEAGKGALAVAPAVWVLAHLHKDMKETAHRMVEFLHRTVHMHPDGAIYRWLLHAIGDLTPNLLWGIFAGIMAYVTIRFVEAAGLWLEKEWAEWFALISGAFYVPFELYYLISHPRLWKAGVLGINLLIVLYLAWLLRDSRKNRKEARAAAAAAAAGPTA